MSLLQSSDAIVSETQQIQIATSKATEYEETLVIRNIDTTKQA